jgi:hypothetical protein
MGAGDPAGGHAQGVRATAGAEDRHRLYGLHQQHLRLCSTANGHRHLDQALGVLADALRLEQLD